MSPSRRNFLKTIGALPLTAALARQEEPLASTPPSPAPASPPPAAHPSRRLLLNRFSIAGCQLELLVEPDNPHDPFSVAIYLGEIKLGCVPRSDNKHLARPLQQDCKPGLPSDRGQPHRRAVEHGTGGGSVYSVTQ